LKLAIKEKRKDFYCYKRYLLVDFEPYEIVKKYYPDEKNYTLFGIEICSPEDKSHKWQYKPYVLKLDTIHRKKVHYDQFKFDSSIFELDGKNYYVKNGLKQIKDDKLWIEFGPIELNKGEHLLNTKVAEDYQVSLVEIKPDIPEVKVENPAEINFKKVNPTKYIVDVDAKKPFTLVFSESYHPKWKAFIDGKAIPDDKHFVVNGYANGFMIDKIGKYQIILEFTPQRLFYIGLIISGITLLGCIIYLIVDKVKEGKNNEVNR